jgi:aspartate carbamoyltransferase regulatory subunit
MAHKLPFQNHFLSKKGPKQVPWIIFVRLKAIFSKTAVKMASKSIKNLVQKIYFYRPHRKILLFRLFLPLFRDAPQSPIEFSNFLTCGNSNQYTNEQSPKNRTAISSKLNFLQIYQYRRHICAISSLMG